MVECNDYCTRTSVVFLYWHSHRIFTWTVILYKCTVAYSYLSSFEEVHANKQLYCNCSTAINKCVSRNTINSTVVENKHNIHHTHLAYIWCFHVGIIYYKNNLFWSTLHCFFLWIFIAYCPACALAASLRCFPTVIKPRCCMLICSTFNLLYIFFYRNTCSTKYVSCPFRGFKRTPHFERVRLTNFFLEIPGWMCKLEPLFKTWKTGL